MTQKELKSEDNAELFRQKGKIGWFLFKSESVITEKELNLPEIVGEFKGDKTPGKRMREILYRIWERTDRKVDSETYYRREVNKICEHLKEKYLS